MEKKALKLDFDDLDPSEPTPVYTRGEKLNSNSAVTLGSDATDAALAAIDALSTTLERRYAKQLKTEFELSRGLVSFQANKSRSIYRWYKFKEAFSADLVEYLLDRYKIRDGVLLDPFAGSGTALFASANLGLSAEGIELLPIGQRIINTKSVIDDGLTQAELKSLKKWADSMPWRQAAGRVEIAELRITKGAYPKDTVIGMEKFLYCLDSESSRVASVLLFALLCVLEIISFTRKDGQYLRWDYRSERRAGKRPFNKGPIIAFDEAISAKLKQIVDDLSPDLQPVDMFKTAATRGLLNLHAGSCLDILPNMSSDSFECVITSPPYCNRYDYTRTYALELAILGVDESHLRGLRQNMLSCTVENRGKDLLGMNNDWGVAINTAEKHELLQSILTYLNEQKESGALNNPGIPRMVRGYFYEMACVIYECGRVLKKGAPLMMVNDNVRYAGVSIPVDLILSDFAKELGFTVDTVLVLPSGKGNSSQQMGEHGRDRLRKCIYIWRKA